MTAASARGRPSADNNAPDLTFPPNIRSQGGYQLSKNKGKTNTTTCLKEPKEILEGTETPLLPPPSESFHASGKYLIIQSPGRWA